ncbi:type III pantothenate kinase [Uliginosibacterium sp. TH139]|uniref:type III pantothenate kinase n=1 Tax=Uliginosibacterium sp. TH139 TaxID=2067453 RepID=UPI000C7D5696|nr:type III pantothenate kinase [Uliginosibacterium sp. TH139]PLK47945.1 type III pantothenate kinase [Uliginosibacterium sp. TH139]
MYLLIDAGNTRLKYACHDGSRWLSQHAVALDAPGLTLPVGFAPARIVIANVAGPGVAAHLERLLTDIHAPCEWLMASAMRCGLRNDYEHPASLGADRWAAAIGAWHMLRSNALVVCAGTATTIDIVQDTGNFAGGCILPGLELMLDALAHNTAGLPRSRGNYVMPPRNTHDAIASGCLLAQTGAIQLIAMQLPPATPILVAGGNGARLLPHLGATARLQSDLVLQGLLAIATDRSETDDKAWRA